MRRSWIEISETRIAHNVAAIRRRLERGVGLIAVVKAAAYGHGVSETGPAFWRAGVTDFAVATAEEGTLLRRTLPQAQILVLGGLQPGEEAAFLEYRLKAAVFDDRTPPAGVTVELKVDTGMARLGISPSDLPRHFERLKGRIAGVYSHFANLEEDRAYSQKQLNCFLELTRHLGLRRHICPSVGLNWKEAHLDAVRPGLALYGVAPWPGFEDLKPVLTWKTHILTILQVPKGQPVGYGAGFVTERPTRLAVLPVGYADGYNRLHFNRGQVRIRGRLAPIRGRISMDLISVDLNEIPEAEVGDVVTLLEGEPDSPLSACSLARQIESIPYEILTSIGARVERRLVA